MISGPRTIGFGLVDGEAVFMDARSDTYFCLDSAHLAHLIGSAQHRHLLEPGDPRLETLGIANEPIELVRADVQPARKSLVDSAAPTAPRLSDVIAIGLLLRDTRDRLRRQPIEECLSDILRNPQRSALNDRSGDDRAARSERFLRARKLVPVRSRDRCLLDSLALLRWLGNSVRGAALVFGVKLNPFAAHCWVQADELVLSDRLETVAAFTPVRILSCSDATQ